jgi:ABC-2 type transport system permease protein
MTILGPLLMGSVIVVPYFMSRVSDEKRNIAVLDESHRLTDKFKSDRYTNFFYVNGSLDSLRKNSSDENISDILYIPATEDIDSLAKAVMLYSTSQPSLNIVERI